MIRLPKLTDYAVLIATELAADYPALVTAGALAKRTGLEVTTVAKLLQALVNGGIAESVRGAGGGYRTVATAQQLTVAGVIAAVEGRPLALTECLQATGICRHDGQCTVRHNWQVINQRIANTLAAVSLADMRRPLTLKNIA